jgi:hypothetical protein
MTIEMCQRCVGSQGCDNEVVEECLPVPFFADIIKPLLRVVTVGLNPALNEYYYDGVPKARNQRLALLADYKINARAELRDVDVVDAKARRARYFNASDRNWHPYFEKMESVINRVNPAWSYWMGSAIHLNLVACATKDRWSELAPETKSCLIGNCREHFLAALSRLPNGTLLLCDGPRVMQELQNPPLRMEQQPAELINIRETGGGDMGWIGKVVFDDKEFPFRGWSSQVSQLSAVWRFDLAFWLNETFTKSKSIVRPKNEH